MLEQNGVLKLYFEFLLYSPEAVAWNVNLAPVKTDLVQSSCTIYVRDFPDCRVDVIALTDPSLAYVRTARPV